MMISFPITFWSGSNGTIPTYAPNPLDYANLRYWLPTMGLHAYQEQMDVPGGQTGVGGFTDPGSTIALGQISNPTCGFITGQGNNGTSYLPPVSVLDPTNTRAMFKFAFPGTTVGSLSLNSGSKAFISLHQGGPFSLSFFIYIPSTTPSTTGSTLYGTTDRASNDAGFSVYLTGSPSGGTAKPSLYINDGTQTLLNFTGDSSQQLAVNTLYCVTMTYAGFNGSNAVSVHVTPYTAGAPGATINHTTSAITLTPSTAFDSWGTLTIGALPIIASDVGTGCVLSSFTGYLGDPLIQFGVMSSTEMAAFLAYLPALQTVTSTSNNLVRQLLPTNPANPILPPQGVNFLRIYYKFNDPTTLYTGVQGAWPSVGATGQLSSSSPSGTSVGTVQNKVEDTLGFPRGTLGRDAITDNVTTPGAYGLPTWVTNVINGQPALFFNALAANSGGAGTRFDDGLFIGRGELITCDTTTIIVAKNNVVGSGGNGQQGSTIFRNNIFFGSGSGNGSIVRWSNQAGSAATMQQPLENVPESWNVMVIRKNNTKEKMTVNTIFNNNTFNPVTLTASSYNACETIGWDGTTNDPAATQTYNANAYVFAMVQYTADIGDALATAVAKGMMQNLGLAFPDPYVLSVQQVSITLGNTVTSATATINPVNNTPIILYQGGTSAVNSSSTVSNVCNSVTYTNPTTITASRVGTSGVSTINAVVLDVTPGLVDSIQYGTVALTAGNATATTTLGTAVDPTRSAVFFLGNTTDQSTFLNGLGSCALTTDGTGVIGTRNSTGGNCTISYCVVQFAAGVTKSVQNKNLVLSTANSVDTQTITSVNTANTLLAWGGNFGADTTTNNLGYLTLTGPTAVSMTRAGTGATSRTVNYTVIELMPGILSNMQRGNIALTGVTSNTATVSSAPTAKSFAYYLGATASTSTVRQIWSAIAQTNATTITASKNFATGNATVGFEIPTVV